MDKLDRLLRQHDRPARDQADWRPVDHCTRIIDDYGNRDTRCHIVVRGRRCDGELPKVGLPILCVRHLVEAAAYVADRTTLEGSAAWQETER